MCGTIQINAKQHYGIAKLNRQIVRNMTTGSIIKAQKNGGLLDALAF